MTRILLAYSVGLHRADPIPALAADHRAEVVTLTLDFGQGRELEPFRDRALAAGAVRAHVLDVVGPFAVEFVLPALRAGALYADGRPRATALGHMMLAQRLAEVAAIEQTTIVAHGCGPANRSLERALKTLEPRITVIDVGRDDRSSGERTGLQTEGPTEPAHVDVAFMHGMPTAVNDIAMPPADLIASLDMLAGPHRVGRYERLDSPGLTVLHAAHAALQSRLAPDTVDDRGLRRRYVELIDAGEWFTAERAGLDTRLSEVEAPVSGSVRVRLMGGDCEVVEIRTPLLDAAGSSQS